MIFSGCVTVESVTRALLCCSKMAEESQQGKDVFPPPPSASLPPGPEAVCGARFQQNVPSQLSKLYQQRQKCELKRLLKHTQPELKMLDEAVDEELAEVLSSEPGVTADETGYEGEVLSRRLMFENCALSNEMAHYSSKMHMTEGEIERGSKTSAVFEEHDQKPCNQSVEEDEKVLAFSPDSNREHEEEAMRVDVQATRRIFEAQPVNISRANQGKKFKDDKTGVVQKQKQEIETCRKDSLSSGNKSSGLPVVSQSADHESSDSGELSATFKDVSTSNSGQDGFEELVKTTKDLFKNNPFISTNIEREISVHTSISQIPPTPNLAAEDFVLSNVKNRAHLFESMPFDQIRHQNKDELETMVENIKETLNTLHHNFNAIHSDGAIIEVNETMIAKKAKFTLSESGPKIKYDEVAEGGAQNFILQLLPRVNLKPQITYLKEDRKGGMDSTEVNVQLTTNQDTQFKTANVVQLVEDILNQDNSLRKGVIIQKDATNYVEVIVYSLYNYLDEEDVKRYRPPQGPAAECDEAETEQSGTRKTENEEIRKGIIKSTISCFTEMSQEQTFPGLSRPDVTVRGNVKLFKSCIEKGDLEYLKTLQAEQAVQEQELPLNKSVAGQQTELVQEQSEEREEENVVEWVPVDIKRLKSMFSGDQSQTKDSIQQKGATISSEFTGQKSLCCAQSGIFQHKQEHITITDEGNSAVAPQGSHLHFETRQEDTVHQAELVKAVDDNDELSNLHTAIHSLQQATIEAKGFTLNESQKFVDQVSSEEVTVSMAAGHSQAEFPQEKYGQKLDALPEQRLVEDTNVDKETCSKNEADEHGSAVPEEQDTEEVVLQGKLQAALESLERSNINVARGDFRAAMIYRNSSKPHKEKSQNVDVASVQESMAEVLCPVTEAKSSQEEVTATNTTPQTEILSKPAVPEKSKRPVGPKPAIPHKPDHLKVKQTNNQFTTTTNVEEIQTKSTGPELQMNKGSVLQTLPTKLVSSQDEHQKSPSKTNSGADNKSESLSQESQLRQKDQGLWKTLKDYSINDNISNKPEVKNATEQEERSKDFPVKENINEAGVEFKEACQKFDAKTAFSAKNAPVKPKRVKIAQNVNPKPQKTLTSSSGNNPNACGQTADSKGKHGEERKQENKVEMRGKKGRTETEDEHRQRLSVHMDEIMRGNITAAMEIFDNLRKQEELQSILGRVEEIEQDTSEVDVRSLRKVYENIPDWVVRTDSKKEKQVKVEHKEETSPSLKDNTQSKSSMANVFGDLEKASEEIMNLKEQTLARLVDIEEAIKKALYSVSTLKCDSDIAGLSCLFKESLGAVQESPSSGNISKISIGSSRTKSLEAQERPTSKGDVALSAGQAAGPEAVSAKLRVSPLSSPAFISIQSAARITDKTEVTPPETTICHTCQQNQNREEKSQTTKTLMCNSSAQNQPRDPRKGGQKQSTYGQLNPKQELSVVEVQTDSEAKNIIGTETVTENYERTDNLGNRFYSTKTSTVVTALPETKTSTKEKVIRPPMHQVTTYPEVRLAINQKP